MDTVDDDDLPALGRALRRFRSDLKQFADLLRADNGPFPRSIPGFKPIVQDFRRRFVRRLESIGGNPNPKTKPMDCPEIQVVLDLVDELETNLNPSSSATPSKWTDDFIVDFVDPIVDKLDAINPN